MVVFRNQASLYPREIQIRHYLAKRSLPTSDWMVPDDHGDWFRDASATSKPTASPSAPTPADRPCGMVQKAQQKM